MTDCGTIANWMRALDAWRWWVCAVLAPWAREAPPAVSGAEDWEC